MIKISLLVVYIITAIYGYGQSDSSAGKFTFTGFVDAYYSYDFNEPSNRDKYSLIYSHNRHNEFAINNMLISVKYSQNKYRAALGLHTGTYVKANYSAEPLPLQYIYEATAGINMHKKVWIDAGIFPSHLGFESAISKDNLTLTRSLTAENSPYYEAGMKVTVTPSSKWVLTALVLNGWQNIYELNSNKAVGSQIQFQSNGKLLINSSTFFGNEKPDSAKQYRFFHDFYILYKIHPKLKMIGGFDSGWEENYWNTGWNFWGNATLITQYIFSESWAASGRIEYFTDQKNVVTAFNFPGGVKTSGFSLNLDYSPHPNVVFRCEGKMYKADKKNYYTRSSNKDNDFMITSSLAIGF